MKGLLSSAGLCLLGLALGLQGCHIRRGEVYPLGKELGELSGIVYDAQDGIACINDSGNPPEVLWVRQEGDFIFKDSIPRIRNRDWEALALKPDGTLFIGDIGDNRLRRKHYQIYCCQSARCDSIQFQMVGKEGKSSSINFEAMFWHRDSLWLFGKAEFEQNSKGFHAPVVVIPDKPGTYTVQPIGAVDVKNFAITGASIHPTSKQVAFVGYQLRRFLGIPRLQVRLALGVYPGDSPLHLSDLRTFSLSPWGIGRPIEAVAFISDSEWIMGSETSPLHRPQIQFYSLKRLP